ncbi:phosphatases II [Schizopora paradoxa]|uniref:Phosphatases II n=1 Tax=Schizopora paradoxa TaxID=27342 RepID=A0A0H2RG69_9AGAM|nr:phosphatases II [Schizopora paradoxa]
MDVLKVTKVEGVLCRRAGRSLRGTLHLTAYHLIITWDNVGEDETWIPYPLISLVTQLPQSLNGYYPLTIHCRDFKTFTLAFENNTDSSNVFDSVKGLTVATSIFQLYAFNYTPNPPFEDSNGWNTYSPLDEFARMGVGTRSKAWRFTDVNKDYTFCPTYPARMVVPARISDTTLQYASKYRSKCRIPSLAYLHWANFGTITRSSQPLVGITNNRSIQDEKLIEAIFQSHHTSETRSTPVYGATTTNLIIDARPTTNAMANVAKGAGTENMDYYKEGKKAYLGIDNIHVMRDSLNKVLEALREAEAETYASESYELSDDQRSPVVLDRQLLRRSGWLRHLSAILDGALLIARNVHVNSSHVLIHCSDGWDRTAQLSSLSQLCLDPFYRTIRGFQILIEKDWLSFGHRFLDRCGHLSSDKFFITASDTSGGGAEAAQAFIASVQNKLGGQHHLKETSPVFHQFLECVRQIQRQFPDRFEFNARYLEQIHYHLYSCQFGTFLFNCERERRLGEGGPSPCDRTVSVWDFLNAPLERQKNVNPSFDPTLDNPSRREPKADMGVLFPNPKDVRFWNELYGRSDEEMNGKAVVAEAQGADIIGPVEGQEDDPIGAPIVAEDLPRLKSPSPSTSPPRSQALTPSPASPSSTAFSKRLGIERSNLATSVSTPTPSPSTSTVSNKSASSRQDGYRPYDPDSKAFTLLSRTTPMSRATPPRESSVSPRPLSKQTEIFSGGMKSMWGKFSTNASAAFTAVQGAYDGVAKEIKGKSTSFAQGWDSPNSRGVGDELQSRSRPQVSDDYADWTTPSSSMSSSSVVSSPSVTENPTHRWHTEGASSRLSTLSLDNPWGSQTQKAATKQESPRKPLDGLFETSQMWTSDPQSPPSPSLPPDPTVLNITPSTSQQLGTSHPLVESTSTSERWTPAPESSSPSKSNGDPLGVL